jgi:hypothetical protein
VNLKTKWKEFSPGNKKKIVWILVGLFLAGILLKVCASHQQGVVHEQKPREFREESSLGIDSRPLQKKQYIDMAQDVDDMKKKVNLIAPSPLNESPATRSPVVFSPAPAAPLPPMPMPSPPRASVTPGVTAADVPLPPPPAPPSAPAEIPRDEFIGSIEQERAVGSGDKLISEGKKKSRRYICRPVLWRPRS